MTDSTEYLLSIIADSTSTQSRVSGAYAAALQELERVDWPTVNHAIIERWSLSGLDRVKRGAWATAARRYAEPSA